MENQTPQCRVRTAFEGCMESTQCALWPFLQTLGHCVFGVALLSIITGVAFCIWGFTGHAIIFFKIAGPCLLGFGLIIFTTSCILMCRESPRLMRHMFFSKMRLKTRRSLGYLSQPEVVRYINQDQHCYVQFLELAHKIQVQHSPMEEAPLASDDAFETTSLIGSCENTDDDSDTSTSKAETQTLEKASEAESDTSLNALVSALGKLVSQQNENLDQAAEHTQLNQLQEKQQNQQKDQECPLCVNAKAEMLKHSERREIEERLQQLTVEIEEKTNTHNRKFRQDIMTMQTQWLHQVISFVRPYMSKPKNGINKHPPPRDVNELRMQRDHIVSCDIEMAPRSASSNDLDTREKIFFTI